MSHYVYSKQVVGSGDFSIMDYLRLIVIAAIFIGIIVVLLYLKSAKSGRKTEGKYTQAANPYDSSSKEEMYAPGIAGDVFSNGEAIKEKKGKCFGGISESEGEIEAVLKDMEGTFDTKLEADIKAVRTEVTTKIEELLLKIKEGEKEVVNKIENVIDSKIQEALNKMNDRIRAALQAQKSSTDSILEKQDDSLSTEEVPVNASSSDDSEATVEEGVAPEEIKEEESEEPIASSEVIEENVLEVDKADSADFDIQEFLEELDNLPSENDPEAEK